MGRSVAEWVEFGVSVGGAWLPVESLSWRRAIACVAALTVAITAWVLCRAYCLGELCMYVCVFGWRGGEGEGEGVEKRMNECIL